MIHFLENSGTFNEWNKEEVKIGYEDRFDGIREAGLFPSFFSFFF